MDRKRQPWTDDERAELLRLVAAGRFSPEIARELGRTQEAVRRQAALAGLRMKSGPTGGPDVPMP